MGRMTRRATRALDPEAVTSRLLHRAHPAPPAWWRTTTVYVDEPPLLDATSTPAQVAAGTQRLTPTSRLGVQAVRIGCPPIPGEADERTLAAVDELIARARRLSMRVLLRMSPHEPRDEASARYWLTRGAGGLDLGPLHDREVSHQRYRELHALLVAYGRDDEPILSSRLTDQRGPAVTELLHEDWLHHLVDARLCRTRDATEVAAVLSDAYASRGPLGAPGGWLVPDVVEAGEATGALTLLTLALPGAVYLRQGLELGMPATISPLPDAGRGEEAAAALAEQRGRQGSWYETVRAALRVRTGHRLAAAPLAIVESLPAEIAATTVALLAGRLLVIANLGAQPVPAPSEARWLLSSTPVGADEQVLVPPGATSWFELPGAGRRHDPRARH